MRRDRSGMLAVAAVLFALGGAAVGQTPTSLPTPPNAVLLLMAQSEASLSDDDFSTAVDALQQLLDLEEDYFDPRAPGRSIKQHAERMLRLLPPAGMDVYERRHGPEAKALLAEAIRFDDDGKLDEVIRRFAMTDAGADALQLLANRQWDGGELLGAGRLFDRLIDHPGINDTERVAYYARSSVCWWGCGNRTRARDRLLGWSHLVERSGAIPNLPFPGETTDVDAALDWLEERSGQIAPPGVTGERITSFRGDSQRSGVMDRATPVGGVLWSYPAADEDDCWEPGRIAEFTSELDALEGQVRAKAGEEHALVPSGMPVIIGNRVVFRGYGTLKWVHPVTGELIWYSADRDDTFKYLVEVNWRPAGEEWHQGNLRLFLGQRGWRDLTSGALTCDERYVYSIFHSGIVSAMGNSVQSVANLGAHELAPRPYNLLVAYETELCQTVWELGGAAGSRDDTLAGVFFLGPPLALDGLLYCLIDDRTQVRLVVINPAIDPATGDAMVWEQSLFNPEHHLSSPLASPRRLSGLTPSAAGDILICPTGESALVAVDRRTRRLLWTFSYREVTITPQDRRIALAMLGRTQSDPEKQILDDLLLDDHWCDSAPIIRGESVLYTPPDQDELLCLRLTDGRLQWRQSREDGVYVAGIHDGNVIIVGSSQVRAVRLSDGAPAWEAPIPIPAPSGRGFQHDHFYMLPLSSGEIASIDLREARILTRSPTTGWVPGNLLSARGRIYSQTAAGLVAFQSLEEQDQQIAERLAGNPDDPEALALRGEQHLHLGRVSAGVADLRRCLSLSDNSRVRALLASTLIEGLRVDFANYLDTADEIDRLVDDDAQRATYLRLLADGLHRSGDTFAAFETYLRFAGEDIDEQLRDGVDGQRLVDLEHWVRVRMDELYLEADEPVRGDLEVLMEASVADAVQAEDARRLRHMLRILPTTAQTGRWRLELVDLLNWRESAAEMELELLKLLSMSDPGLQGAAAARLLNLYLHEKVAGPVPTLAARLSGPDADRICLDGRTGAQLLQAWSGEETRQALLAPAEVWPLAHLHVDADSPANPQQSYPVEHLGSPSLTLRDWQFHVDVAGNSLLAFDEQGNDRWRESIDSGGGRRTARGFANVRYIRTLGRLVLLVTNDAFLVLDAFAEDRERVLVRQALEQVDERRNALFRFQVGPRVNPRGALRNQLRIANNQASGNVGPLLAGGLVYQQDQTLRSIDPLTGEEFWQRESPEAPSGAEIIADDEFVVVWPANSNHVLVLRAADGALLRQSNLPAEVLKPQPDGDWGRCIVLEETSRGREPATTRLELYDPARQETVWELQFDDLLDWTVVDGRDFGLLHSGGRFTLIDGLTGAERFSQQLGDTDAQEISVERLHDELLVMTASRDESGSRVQPWPEFDFPFVHGEVSLLSVADGRMEWSRPVEHQTLLRHLPGRWPFLAFVANRIEPGRVGGQNYTSALLLSRRTGEVLHTREWDRPPSKFAWLARPDQRRIQLNLGMSTLTLNFTDESPAAPDEARGD